MSPKVACLTVDAACNNCVVMTHLLSNQCSSYAIEALSGIVDIKGPFFGGQRIFSARQSSQSLYVVREGAVKCERPTESGGLHVVGFYLAGDLFGCEDIGAPHHSYDAVALEESWVCEISIQRLEAQFRVYPDLQHFFLARISERIRTSERILTDSFSMRAKSRLTNFLHEFYVRISQGKEQIGRSLYLPMHKVDIANHLGISPETLSRLLRELEEDGCIRNGVGQIELLQPEQNTSGSGKKCFYY